MKLVVLDRDGVINQDSERYIKSPEEWIPIPGSLEAIARLNHAAYRVTIATNQSGLGRGYFDIDAVNRIHRKMRRELSVLGAQVEAIFFCPHAPEASCGCRKPRPGLLVDLAERLGIEMAGIPVVGDSLRDIQAALAVGAAPILVLTGNGQMTLKGQPSLKKSVPIFTDLAAAVDNLLLQ